MKLQHSAQDARENMNCFVAFLRGMNIGRRRIMNKDLCFAFEHMGFKDVSAFLASGNVIFNSTETDPVGISRLIETGLKKSLDYEVPTFLRTACEVKTIGAYTPFDSVVTDYRGKIQVAMFYETVCPAKRTAVLKLSSSDDLLEIDGRELYWMPSGNFLESKLDIRTIENLLGPLTIRTKRTIERIVSRYLTE